MKVFIHLGAGAGDLDSGSNFNCGFTKFVKKNYFVGDKIVCLEANPLNIENLKKTYLQYKDVEIYNLAISLDDKKKIKFFYTDEDAPHYQVASIREDHVKKHYPDKIIKSKDIKAISINNFLKLVAQYKIDYLSIDLEGIDYDIILEIDYEKFDIKNISVEYLHLSKFQKKNVINFLLKKGYSYYGYGYDHNNCDYLFKKKKNYWNILLSKLFLWFISNKHCKYFNYFIFK